MTIGRLRRAEYETSNIIAEAYFLEKRGCVFTFGVPSRRRRSEPVPGDEDKILDEVRTLQD
jgi:hypothetical protein